MDNPTIKQHKVVGNIEIYEFHFKDKPNRGAIEIANTNKKIMKLKSIKISKIVGEHDQIMVELEK